jgi:FAS-associated factor 2
VQRERESERFLREEQDRAFQDSVRKDRERIETRIALDRQQAEDRKRKEDLARAEEDARALAQEESLARERVRMSWRRWARRTLVKPEDANARGNLRIAVRLPNDARIVRYFSPTTTLTTLYAFVDCQMIPPEFAPEDDPLVPPSGSSDETAIEEQLRLAGDGWWGFKLVSAYPRHEISWSPNKRLSEIDVLKGGVQIVAELVREMNDRPVSDDGYETEDSE